MIKPIETEYNGYRFRSRLEARWAVFFDTAGIKYVYEPEGFELSCGRYLPDFYLPEFKCYVEVKRMGLPNKNKQKVISTLKELFMSHGDCCAMLVEGDPMDSVMTAYCNDITDSSGGGPEAWEAQFIMGGWFEGEHSEYSGGKRFISLCLGGSHDRNRTFCTSDFGYLPHVEQFCRLCSCRSDLLFAKEKARQARFEYGDTP